jgi:hypothetical protein
MDKHLDNGAMLEMAQDYLTQAIEIMQEISNRPSFQRIQNEKE